MLLDRLHDVGAAGHLSGPPAAADVGPHHEACQGNAFLLGRLVSQSRMPIAPRMLGLLAGPWLLTVACCCCYSSVSRAVQRHGGRVQAAVMPAWRCPSGRPLHCEPGLVSSWFPAFTGQEKDCEQSWAAVAPLHQPSSVPQAVMEPASRTLRACMEGVLVCRLCTHHQP